MPVATSGHTIIYLLDHQTRQHLTTKPLKVNVKGLCLFMLEHHCAYQFGISPHGCFIESSPSHQGSVKVLVSQRQLSPQAKHSKTMLCDAFLKIKVVVLLIFPLLIHYILHKYIHYTLYNTGAYCTRLSYAISCH